MPISTVGAALSNSDRSAAGSQLQSDSVLVKIAGLPDAKLSDDEVVVLDVTQAKYYGLSGPGAKIWALLESETTLEELCAGLMKEFDVSRDVCLKATRDFVGELLRENLMRVVSQR